MDEYILRRNVEKLGRFAPVLVDVNGNVIDGFHRIAFDPAWKHEFRTVVKSVD